SEEAANTASTQRKMRVQPMRWPSFAPVITSAATARPYTTMVELATVGGTEKSSTMPPSEMGSAATLNDISTWARKSPIIGVQERRAVSSIGALSCGAVGAGGEEVQPEGAGEVGAGALAAHAVAGPVQRWGERPERALAGGDRDDPAGDPGLRGQADLELPFAGALVHPAGGEHGQGVPAGIRGDALLPGERVQPAVGEGRAHHGEVLGRDPQRALAGVDLDHLLGPPAEAAVGGEQVGDPLVAVV